MARKRGLKQRLVTAKSELRQGFKIPTKKTILAKARQLSKVRLMSILWFMFGKLSKTDKIKVLVKIDSSPKSSKNKKRKAKRKTRRAKTKKRKTARKAKNGRKKPRTAKQKAASRRNIKKARAARRKR